MAKEADKIRLPELPIFKKYSLAVRQEYVTPQEVLAALERTTARVERLMEKAEEDRRRREEAERGEAERLALEEQEEQWAVESQEAETLDGETQEADGEDIPETMEVEKAEEVAPLDRSTERILFEDDYLKRDDQAAEPEDERPFWEIEEDELPVPRREEQPPPESPPPRPKPKAKKAKPRAKPQVVQVSHRGRPIMKKATSKPPAKKSPAKKKTARTAKAKRKTTS